MRECPTVRVTVPNAPPVVSVPVQVPPVIKLAGGVRGAPGEPGPAGAAGEGVPAGGTTGQALVKASDADHDTEYKTVHELPAGGHLGQVLRKVNNDDYNTEWVSIREAPMFPGGGGWKTIYASPGSIPAYIQAPRPATGQPAGQILVTHGGNPTVPDPYQSVEAGAEWLDYTPVPPATATTVPQALTIPATTPVEDARNLYPNPTAVPGGAGWINGSTGGTITMTGNGYELTRGTSGTFSAEPGGLTAGTIGAYYSMRAKVSALTANMVGKPIYLALNNGSIFLAGSPDVSAGVYPPLGQSVTVTLPATLAADTTGLIRPYLYLRGGAVEGDKVLLNEIDIRRVNGTGQSITGDFFTGDTPDTDTHQYTWAGAPHNSASIRYTVDTTIQWAPTLPPPPPTGTHTLKSVDGVMAWVEA